VGEDLAGVNEHLNVGEFLEAAAAKVDPAVWCYFEGGADDEVTLQENITALRRWQLRPRMLVDVGQVRLETTLLGTTVSMPLGIAPFALQRLLDPEAELATARAAAAAGALVTVPTLTSFRHAELQAAVDGPRWLQLYVQLDRALTLDHLAEAREAGYSAVVLTVDLPQIGRRERDLRLGFAVPPEIPLPYGTLIDVDPTITWRDLEWVRDATELPLVVKGIVTREDALLAAEHGVDAVWVSNHGGRQLDRVAASIDALPEVVEAVAGRCEVYVDSGFRRGTDVIVALALGARAAFVGRPVAAGLAVAGEAGVVRVLELLRAEIELALGLLGCTRPEDVTRAHVQRGPA
jgi:isopentenyl diphosphate isomerase/L-lactate dehydrogenase-like FMN-dependent dehydrogenase